MRNYYNNGDEISLTANGCDGCNPAMIQGVFCHETGCPDAWKDSPRDCMECGFSFQPELHYQGYCQDCKRSC